MTKASILNQILVMSIMKFLTLNNHLFSIIIRCTIGKKAMLFHLIKNFLHYYRKHPFPTCAAEFPLPFIMCPADISKSLGGSSTSLYVMFPQPKTNVDWFR